MYMHIIVEPRLQIITAHHKSCRHVPSMLYNQPTLRGRSRAIGPVKSLGGREATHFFECRVLAEKTFLWAQFGMIC